MEERNKTVLAEFYTPPTPFTALELLSPAQLAISSMDLSLTILMRQRTYAAFQLRRDAYQSSGRTSTQEHEPLFDLPLDFPIPEKLAELQPIGLLLLQFNPRSSSTIVEAASSLFFAELDEAQRAFEDVTLSLQGYKMTRELGAQEKRGRFCFEWRGEQLQVLREEGEKVEVTIQAEDVESMELVIAEVNSTAAGEKATLLVRARKLSTLPSLTILSVDVSLYVDPGGSSTEISTALGRNVKRWKEAVSTSSRAVEPQEKRSPSTSISPSLLSKRYRVSSSPPGHTGSTASRPASYFLGANPAVVEWQPGFYVRQIAFIESSGLSDTTPPAFNFTPEDIDILSFAPDPAKLPSLPLPPSYLPAWIKHNPAERLALEMLFRPLNLSFDDMRTILLTDTHPDLRNLARLASAIIGAKDYVTSRFKDLLTSLRHRRGSLEDPIEQLIVLVESLKANLGIRKSYFSDSACQLARKSYFLPSKVGVEIARRYEEKLAKIVEYEEKLAEIVEYEDKLWREREARLPGAGG